MIRGDCTFSNGRRCANQRKIVALSHTGIGNEHSHIARLGWRLLQEPEALWSQVLRAKYWGGGEGSEWDKGVQTEGRIIAHLERSC